MSQPIATGIKWFIKFDPDEKQYIYYRIMKKEELQTHLANAQKQAQDIMTIIDEFQAYIDDPRVEEPKK